MSLSHWKLEDRAANEALHSVIVIGNVPHAVITIMVKGKEIGQSGMHEWSRNYRIEPFKEEWQA